MRQINVADTSLRLDDQRPVDSLTGMKGQISAKLATFITAHWSTPFSVSVPAPPLQNSNLVQPVPTFAEQRSCPTWPHLCRTPILSNLSPPLQNTDLVQPVPTFAEHRSCPTWPHSAGGPAGDAVGSGGGVPCLPAVDCRRCHGNRSDHSAWRTDRRGIRKRSHHK